jgi:uncharacterized repeat protein (TIGR04138 family)
VHKKLLEILEKDPRYKLPAYIFVLASLEGAKKKLKKERIHLTAQELLEGFKDLAQNEFGALAKTVLESWGIKSTADVGEIVFNLIEAQLLTKTPEDKKEDFAFVFDFDEVFVQKYEFSTPTSLRR